MERSSRQFRGLLAFCAILAVHMTVSSAGDVSGRDNRLNYFTVSSECEGFGIGECLLVGEEEEAMKPESNRRILATRQYIGYSALRRNSIPCSRRGSSYYNCRRGAQANPYSRSCSKITRCRR